MTLQGGWDSGFVRLVAWLVSLIVPAMVGSTGWLIGQTINQGNRLTALESRSITREEHVQLQDSITRLEIELERARHNPPTWFMDRLNSVEGTAKGAALKAEELDHKVDEFERILKRDKPPPS